ncbi:MAG: TolC family protein [Bacteroidia bacterium]
MFKISTIILALLCFGYSHGQDNENATPSELTTNAITNGIELPLLDSLITAGLQHSPLIKSAETVIAQNQIDLNLEKRTWAEIIQINASSSGISTQGNVLLADLDDAGQIIAGTANAGVSNLAGLSSRAGVSLRLSLYDFYARPKELDKVRLQIEESEYLLEEKKQALTTLITDLYIELKLALKVVELQQTTYATFSAQYQMAEKEFREGEVAITDLARITEVKAKSELALEQSKSNYEKLYRQMEVIVGRDLNSFE